MTIAFPRWLAILLWPAISCTSQPSPNQKMINLLSTVATSTNVAANPFASESRLPFYDSLLQAATVYPDSATAIFAKANTYLELGEEEKAITLLEKLFHDLPPYLFDHKKMVLKTLAMCHLRLGERKNCIYNHTGESCIYPISGKGIHVDKKGAEKAIELYKTILKYDGFDLESRWLLNIAYMAAGGYPDAVPPKLLLNISGTDSSCTVKPFTDLSARVGLNIKNMAGGSIIEDLNNDGYVDIVTSSWGLQEGMHYYTNNRDGTFKDATASSGLKYLTGGLNLLQTDYNNDGWKDIFVLRGAWKDAYGKEPNSLLRNNGDGSFTDVTHSAGLLSFHPTQTATWADFNNDGWLDLFIGNETGFNGEPHPCELYINNRNGTFSEAAAAAGCRITAFVKGVTSGDYDNDGWMDIFLSTLDGKKILLKNEGISNGAAHFRDVSQQAGLGNNRARTFTTWFFDYDNDGWLDILVCGYEFSQSLAWYAAAEALNMPQGHSGKINLYRNRHNGTFEDVSARTGLNRIAFAMGGNFGDIDNDGWLDFYLGTGNPQYASLVPNKLFKNVKGQRFADVTTPARVGNLQKGHGVSFVDLDNDGDQDIYIEMGGAYVGDAYENALYINSGESEHHRILLSLQGNTCNRAAIGARLKITFTDNGIKRTIYRDVNSGGSFGANPLMQHIGIGRARLVDEIVVQWPGSRTSQVFTQVPADMVVSIKQDIQAYTVTRLKTFNFNSQTPGIIHCFPSVKPALTGK
ncbi:CRTAC1 family protein [Longitalea arenae]|uniref:CRTAC1 family protein n=1 Tax=Longitalea arenae TaxID=2812558 RepID=UPI00196761C6|nr:CRTAC1 family protein [Longitalea arenae]